MKLIEYRELTAKMCGVDLDGWHPETNYQQMTKVADILIERGYGFRDHNFITDGKVLWSTVELFNIRRDHIFPGDGETTEKAFMNAFIEYNKFDR